MTVGAVVVAAGTGQRLGAPGPKALVELAGRPLVAWAVDRIAEAGIGRIVVVHPAGLGRRFAEVLEGCEVTALVEGGATRTASVRAGVAALDADVAVVAVHDAARAFVPAAVVTRTVERVGRGVLAAAPSLPVPDTLKRVEGKVVIATVSRDGLVAVQTPQVFTRAALEHVLATGDDATDELVLVERAVADGELAGRVEVVAGSAQAHKLTTTDDLVLLEALAGR